MRPVPQRLPLWRCSEPRHVRRSGQNPAVAYGRGPVTPKASEERGTPKAENEEAETRKEASGCRSGQVELLSDAVQRHAVEVVGGGFADSLDGLEIGLAAESEGLVVDGEEEFGTGVLGHLPSLLGVAVRSDPRVVGTDGHDREVPGSRGLKGTE